MLLVRIRQTNEIKYEIKYVGFKLLLGTKNICWRYLLRIYSYFVLDVIWEFRDALGGL